MALRPGRTVRKKKRPYTRVSKRKPRKSYVTGVPYPRIHIFEMGKKDGKFKTVLYLVAKDAVQIRDNALESARIVSSKYLATKLGHDGFFMKILVYPHQVLREHSIAMGAGADRYSQGMAHAFGRPSGLAVQTKVGQRLILVRTKKASIKVAKEALKRASSKLSSRTKIEVEE
jgi:large subunit ribosomal protein L10e